MLQTAVKPRILFYTHALLGGGAERVWAQTAAGLFERGYPVQFAVDAEASANVHLIPPEMPFHVLGSPHAHAIRRLAGLLRSEKPAYVFSAVGASNVKLLAAKAMALSPARAVLSQHGHFEAESRFLGRAAYRLTAVTSRLSSRTVVVSDALRDDLITRWKGASNRIVRIYNAIALNPPESVLTRQSLKDRPDRVLAVGRLVPEKGHVDLIRAIAKLPRSVTLTIAGEGPYRLEVERVIAELGLAERVQLLGYQADLAPVYAEAKVFVLPSHTEAFGNVLVEAMGYGLPVISTSCGGPSEILGH
ncbi:MAG TPA: hypothetical protein DCL54_01465, partial [Alphaproteobacteria bacterium]|nr:hypothetical protein [Alphaproteobacteria bacterium]